MITYASIQRYVHKIDTIAKHLWKLGMKRYTLTTFRNTQLPRTKELRNIKKNGVHRKTTTHICVIVFLGIKYRVQNGCLYPILPSDNAAAHLDVGKYGRMWLHILFETNRRGYNRRLFEGTLIDDAVCKNEEAYEIIDFLTSRELQRLSCVEKNSSLAIFQCRMAARVTAEEKFLATIRQELNTKKRDLKNGKLVNTQLEESEE